MAINLDEKDKRAYSLIRNKLMHEGKKPTLREINAVTGGKSPRSASLVIDRLIRMGLLRKAGKALKLAEKPSLSTTTSISTINIPLVGSVACGLPILAQENIETYIPVSTAIAKKGSEYFLLRACGDSMNETGINDGDILLIRQQSYADSGKRVVALINDEATVKILDRQKDAVILRPKSSNSKHKPIIVTDDCQIQGEVIAVLPRDIF
jgi:repressor LexA